MPASPQHLSVWSASSCFKRPSPALSLDALVILIPQMSPANPVSIPPYAQRLIFLPVRPEAQDVAIQVFNLHLQRPLEILRRVPDLCAGRHILTVQHANILHADPHPHTRLALVVTGQEDGALIARHTGKPVPVPAQLEAQSIPVVGDAGFYVFD